MRISRDIDGGYRIALSQRNMEMLKHYGAIHKGMNTIVVESNDIHYTPEQEKQHQLFTDPLMKGNE